MSKRANSKKQNCATSDGNIETSRPSETKSRKRTRIAEKIHEKSKNLSEKEKVPISPGAKKRKKRHQTATRESLSSSSDGSQTGSQNLFESKSPSQNEDRESETERVRSSKSSSFDKYLQVTLLQ